MEVHRGNKTSAASGDGSSRAKQTQLGLILAEEKRERRGRKEAGIDVIQNIMVA